MMVYQRHCERSEAIHSFFAGRNGLLRCARNDVATFRFDFQTDVRPRPRDMTCQWFCTNEEAGNAGCALHPRLVCNG